MKKSIDGCYPNLKKKKKYEMEIYFVFVFYCLIYKYFNLQVIFKFEVSN